MSYCRQDAPSCKPLQEHRNEPEIGISDRDKWLRGYSRGSFLTRVCGLRTFHGNASARRHSTGLEFHLARLRSASIEFFGQALPDDLVRERIRHAIESAPSALSVTATMFSRRGEFTPTGASDDPAILVRTAPPFDGPAGPFRLSVVQHERPFPTIKHVGEASKTQYLRQAVKRAMTTQHSSIPVGA